MRGVLRGLRGAPLSEDSLCDIELQGRSRVLVVDCSEERPHQRLGEAL